MHTNATTVGSSLACNFLASGSPKPQKSPFVLTFLTVRAFIPNRAVTCVAVDLLKTLATVLAWIAATLANCCNKEDG